MKKEHSWRYEIALLKFLLRVFSPSSERKGRVVRLEDLPISSKPCQGTGGYAEMTERQAGLADD